MFVDNKDIIGLHGGDVYTKFGIDSLGVVIIVRPDGYVGMVAPFDTVHDIDLYFSSFMALPDSASCTDLHGSQLNI